MDEYSSISYRNGVNKMNKYMKGSGFSIKIDKKGQPILDKEGKLILTKRK